MGRNVTVEFAGNGPIQGFKCKLDRAEYYECMLMLTVCVYLLCAIGLGRPAHTFCLCFAMVRRKTCTTENSNGKLYSGNLLDSLY